MTLDERVEKLAAQQERTQAQQDKTQVLLAAIGDGIQRLERIALAHRPDLDDIQKGLDELERRRQKKPR